MDYGRSCYRRRMRYVAGDLGAFTPVTWYFCAPTAVPFPTQHRFGSANWDMERNWFSDLGDDAQSTRTYYNGRRLNRSDGTTFAGPLEYFQLGAPAAGPIPRGFGGTPVECLKPPFGLAKGGTMIPVDVVRGGIFKGASSTPGSVPVVCADLGTASRFALIQAATGPASIHVGSTITMVFAFGLWAGTIGSGTNQILLVATCSPGLWSVLPAVGILGPGPTMDTTQMPINFTDSSACPGGTITVKFS